MLDARTLTRAGAGKKEGQYSKVRNGGSSPRAVGRSAMPNGQASDSRPPTAPTTAAAAPPRSALRRRSPPTGTRASRWRSRTGGRPSLTERFEDPWYQGESVVTNDFVEQDGRTTATMTMRFESREARDG